MYIHKSKNDLFSILAGAGVVRVHASEASYRVKNLIISKSVLRSPVLNLSSYLSLMPGAYQELLVCRNGAGRYQESEADNEVIFKMMLGARHKSAHKKASTYTATEVLPQRVYYIRSEKDAKVTELFKCQIYRTLSLTQCLLGPLLTPFPIYFPDLEIPCYNAIST